MIDASSRIFPDLCLCSTDVVEEEDGEEESLRIGSSELWQRMHFLIMVDHFCSLLLGQQSPLLLDLARSLSGMTGPASTTPASFWQKDFYEPAAISAASKESKRDGFVSQLSAFNTSIRSWEAKDCYISGLRRSQRPHLRDPIEIL